MGYMVIQHFPMMSVLFLSLSRARSLVRAGCASPPPSVAPLAPSACTSVALSYYNSLVTRIWCDFRLFKMCDDRWVAIQIPLPCTHTYLLPFNMVFFSLSRSFFRLAAASDRVHLAMRVCGIEHTQLSIGIIWRTIQLIRFNERAQPLGWSIFSAFIAWSNGSSLICLCRFCLRLIIENEQSLRGQYTAFVACT